MECKHKPEWKLRNIFYTGEHEYACALCGETIKRTEESVRHYWVRVLINLATTAIIYFWLQPLAIQLIGNSSAEIAAMLLVILVLLFAPAYIDGKYFAQYEIVKDDRPMIDLRVPDER